MPELSVLYLLGAGFWLGIGFIGAYNFVSLILGCIRDLMNHWRARK